MPHGVKLRIRADVPDVYVMISHMMCHLCHRHVNVTIMCPWFLAVPLVTPYTVLKRGHGSGRSAMRVCSDPYSCTSIRHRRIHHIIIGQFVYTCTLKTTPHGRIRTAYFFPAALRVHVPDATLCALALRSSLAAMNSQRCSHLEHSYTPGLSDLTLDRLDTFDC